MKAKYLSLASRSMQNSMAYRVSFIVNMSASVFYILAMFFLWRAIYAHRTSLAGYSWNDMKAYLLVSFLSSTMLSWYSESRMSSRILDGSVAMELLKPIDFQAARLAETAGTTVFEGGVSAVLVTIVLIVYAGVMTPHSLAAWIAFILSFAVSVLIKFGVVYISSLFCFWTSSGFGVAWARAAITNLLSGALIPLAFFPPWLRTVAYLLPFQGIVNAPASIYLGQATGTAVWDTLLVQVFWCVVLSFLGRFVWRFAVRKVTIFGG